MIKICKKIDALHNCKSTNLEDPDIKMSRNDQILQKD